MKTAIIFVIFSKSGNFVTLFSLNEMRESMEKKQLKREITTFGALSTVMGTVIALVFSLKLRVSLDTHSQ